MEKLDIDYSLKNIPIPSNESYLIKLIEKIESVVKRMRWRAHFFLQEKHESNIRREDVGFKSKSLHHNASIWKHLKRNYLT